MEYDDFIESKSRLKDDHGFFIDRDKLNISLFEYQKDIVQWALKKGSAAIFADTGLGKTVMQCEWAKHVVEKIDCSVLILAPLCIAEQTQKEAKDVLGLDVVKYDLSCDVKKGCVYVTNYEQIKNIDFSKFGGIVLDESSILKHRDSKTRMLVIKSVIHINYRLSLTATPAPNDYMEFGSQCEFLGVMSQESMWATFFINDVKESSKWRLKKHCQEDFWEWVSSWSVIFRRPSDIGHPENDFDLPPLHYINVIVNSGLNISDYLEKNGMGLLGRNRARRDTIDKRVDQACHVVDSVRQNNPCEPVLIWCNLNDESAKLYDALNQKYDDVVEVSGQQKDEKKKDGLVGFSSGKYSILITKPKIAGFGMNWQHCSNMIFVGLNDSYEQLYQAARRCYRFGQNRPVSAYLITADIENAVLENINEKDNKMKMMYENIISHMSEFQSKGIVESESKKNRSVGDVYKDDNFEIYNGDCVKYLKTIDDESIDYSIFSPPFASLYTYSDDDRDMGNSRSDDEFYQHFDYMLKELHRAMSSGRLVSIHCMNLPTSKSRHGFIGIRDFRGDIIRMMQKHGFIYASEVTVWKCPVVAMQRTKALGLLWKQIKKDSTMNRQGIPDYVMTFRKTGENKKPVAHTPEQFPVDRWQNLAQPTWQNIRQSNTMNFRHARDDRDERHICPLQLDLIERCLELWTMPDDVVFSPFTGIGSEGVVSLEMGRKFKGSELKPSYFDVAKSNLDTASGDVKRKWPCDPAIYDSSFAKKEPEPKQKKQDEFNLFDLMK